MRAVHADPYLDAMRVLRVDPTTVRLMAVFGDAYASELGYGHVVDGDWDLASRVNEEQRYFRVVAEAFSRGIPWSATETGREARQTIEGGGTWMGYDDLALLEERQRSHDELLRSMRSSGFLTQRQLRRQRPPSFTETMVDEILVAVGRDGGILLVDGRHRFAMACLLGIETIPVQVGVRHPVWMAFRRNVAAYARAHGGAAPQPLLHPDLDNIPAAEDSAAVFDAIRAALPRGRGTVLDIGSLWGYYAHRCEDAGFDCVALEERAEHRYFLERLRVAGGRRFRCADGGSPPTPPPSGDYAAALALERVGPEAARDHQERLTSLLARTSVSTVFVRPHVPRLAGTTHTRPPVDDSWTSRLVAEAGFRRWDLVAAPAGVPILKLDR